MTFKIKIIPKKDTSNWKYKLTNQYATCFANYDTPSVNQTFNIQYLRYYGIMKCSNMFLFIFVLDSQINKFVEINNNNVPKPLESYNRHYGVTMK